MENSIAHNLQEWKSHELITYCGRCNVNFVKHNLLDIFLSAETMSHYVAGARWRDMTKNPDDEEPLAVWMMTDDAATMEE